MDWLPVIYLVYMFFSIYFMSLFILLFVKYRKVLFSHPAAKKEYSVSFLVPAYNERDTIADTLKSIFSVDYPLEEVIVINDGSTDDTKKILEKLKQKYSKLKIINKENSGKADSLNQGLKIAKGEIVAVVDADSYPAKDSVRKMLGFFNNENTAVVTCFIVPKNKRKFVEKAQAIEYNVIGFTRKLLGYLGCIYVTPGPLALYRKNVLKKVGGFDKESMTEDIEATWRLAYHGYGREMCLDTYATTTVPAKVKGWYRQRKRWNIGGLQCISKYKSSFLRRGVLGFFILPFFVLQYILGFLGLGIFVYLVTTRFLKNYIFVKSSLVAGASLLTMNDLYITPSVLNYFGVVLFVFGTIFTLGVLYVMKEETLSKQNIFNLAFYSVFYMALYPIILVPSVVDYFRGRRRWR